MLDDPLVEALEARREQRQPLAARELLHELLVELPPLRRQRDDTPTRILAVHGLEGRVYDVDAEDHPGAALAVQRADLPETRAGEYYVFQLAGLAVEEEGGRPLGRVQDVAPGVANDVLELDTGTALPLVEDCVLSVDLGRGRILAAEGFTEHD